MGAPTSAILAEIFIQHLENTDITYILQKHHIIDYYRYVDEILIVYKEDHTNIEDTLNEFNSIHPNIQYTMERQINNKQNYLDISIENTHNTFTFSIYRKSTTSDLIIHNDSCHPTEHKYSAIKYFINRMNTYPVSTESKHSESQLKRQYCIITNTPQNTLIHKNKTTYDT
jgi:hypothetical protein